MLNFIYYPLNSQGLTSVLLLLYENILYSVSLVVYKVQGRRSVKSTLWLSSPTKIVIYDPNEKL